MSVEVGPQDWNVTRKTLAHIPGLEAPGNADTIDKSKLYEEIEERQHWGLAL